ncbi:hypothetical protein HRR83_006162 [Exophiala dermatitidis]|uniref:Clr5 domain-containing protein n=2 Tax=Exophiala dermatitidis TaxID=5970 RepID=H6BMC1_EXODN|nr:uncharacterized protein HMPREF1120_01203 [Exophiala dermatitidis NIH/UT8656]KAJ4515094.1 hypothetical protein HRR74_005559 [Exophiala dermatitidis]EHY53002.1 hypothetical protein HMPREF1120_01203 [Exophiala dermatitidis NIH/UT8656]KAJ4517586.1 hypothetical protein HRR73_004638 [Exophiala dermatitidis]KAJ4548655.1 hypothetical protein HRR76_001244 [Exophiala dermatitidis]KAJ4550469.1 hypothetical protein HRR78_004238 [Exophiala dermatitidis]
MAKHPSKEDWEEKKAVIRQMYLYENRTCAQVQDYLQEHGFHVNTRQIKNKLNEWGFERKKTRAEQYLAMLYVANIYAAHGSDVIFNVPKREERQDYSTRKIRKECDRIRKKRDRDRPLSEPQTLGEAQKILVEADIECRGTSGPRSPDQGRQRITSSHGCSPREITFDFRRADSPDMRALIADINQSDAASGTGTPVSVEAMRDSRKHCGSESSVRSCSSQREHKVNASKWVKPYYTQCFATPVSKGTFEGRKRQAMQILDSILKQDNPYIFPTLAEMVMIFGSNQRTGELAEFLSDSCSVIDACQGSRGSFTYATPFRYTLAFTKENQNLMRQYGAQLHRSMTEIRQIWGEEHPNFLVNANFCAWHWMQNLDYHLAIPLLRHCLPICERVMGPCSLVTINCLVITSRAHAEVRNNVWARHCLETAMLRIDGEREDLEQFRLVLLHRLGELNMQTGNYQATEMQFWKVLQDRARICGLDAEATWSAAHSLCELFATTARGDLAAELLDYMRDRLEWVSIRRAYYLGKTETGCSGEPPVPPWWWPYGTEDD